MCHESFHEPIDLSYAAVAKLVAADALGIQNRLTNIRVILLRIIDKWEQSGQGDGGRFPGRDEEEEEDDESPSWGKLEGRSQEALDNRANFLGGSPPWYLYFWEMADRYQLLTSTLQRLSGSVGAACANATRSVSKSKRTVEYDRDSSAGDSFSKSEEELHIILKTLIACGEEDRLQARELDLQRRIDATNSSIKSYQEKFELTEKPFYTSAPE